MFNILVVEDDRKLRNLFCTVLMHSGYYAIPAENGMSALEILDTEYVDLIISDIMMPGTDGFAFAETIRRLNKRIPILFVSARDDLSFKQRGFDLGIDDYMVKPLDLSELLMRVRALLRRANIEASRRLTVGSLVLDADAMEITQGEQEIPVTTREFNIMFKLLSYPNHTFSRSQLMDEFWGVDSDTSLRAVDVYITKLRDKFSACNEFEIRTIRGLGYKAVLL